MMSKIRVLFILCFIRIFRMEYNVLIKKYNASRLAGKPIRSQKIWKIRSASFCESPDTSISIQFSTIQSQKPVITALIRKKRKGLIKEELYLFESLKTRVIARIPRDRDARFIADMNKFPASVILNKVL